MTSSEESSKGPILEKLKGHISLLQFMSYHSVPKLSFPKLSLQYSTVVILFQYISLKYQRSKVVDGDAQLPCKASRKTERV